jgi:hypothetical protein
MNNKYEKESKIFSNDRMFINPETGEAHFGSFNVEVSKEKPYIEIHTGHYLDGRKEHLFVENGDSMEEVIKIHHKFFQKPYKNQKATLRLLMWWSIKHYFKILFK